MKSMFFYFLVLCAAICNAESSNNIGIVCEEDSRLDKFAGYLTNETNDHGLNMPLDPKGVSYVRFIRLGVIPEITTVELLSSYRETKILRMKPQIDGSLSTGEPVIISRMEFVCMVSYVLDYTVKYGALPFHPIYITSSGELDHYSFFINP